jgi:NhaP-type Na+/H+ or K+/H+ antiporter
MKRFATSVKENADELLIMFSWSFVTVALYQESKENFVLWEYAMLAILSYFMTRFLWLKIFRPIFNFTDSLSDKIYRKITGDTKPRY